MPIKTSLTALAVALAAAVPAVAQDAATPQPAPQGETAPGAEAARYSDEKLEAFVTAALEVSEIQQETTSQLQGTQDQAEQASLVEQANAEMVAAIEAQEAITVPEYVEIAEAAETDPALRAKLEQMLQEAQTQ